MLSAYYVCCIYSYALQTSFITEGNTMNPDQTASKEAVWSGFILFEILATKVHYKQKRKSRQQLSWKAEKGLLYIDKKEKKLLVKILKWKLQSLIAEYIW